MVQCDDCGSWYDSSLSRCKFCGYDPEQGAEEREEAVDKAIAEEEAKPKPPVPPVTQAKPVVPIPEAPKRVEPPLVRLKDPHLYERTIQCPDCGRVYSADGHPETCSLCSETLPEPRLLSELSGPVAAASQPVAASTPAAPPPVPAAAAKESLPTEAQYAIAALIAKNYIAQQEAARPKPKKPSIIAFIILLIIAFFVLILSIAIAGPLGILVAVLYLFACINWYVRRLRASR